MHISYPLIPSNDPEAIACDLISEYVYMVISDSAGFIIVTGGPPDAGQTLTLINLTSFLKRVSDAQKLEGIILK